MRRGDFAAAFFRFFLEYPVSYLSAALLQSYALFGGYGGNIFSVKSKCYTQFPAELLRKIRVAFRFLVNVG